MSIRGLSRLFLLFLGLVLVPSACKKAATTVPPKAATPAPREALQQADRAFDVQDYALAAENYEVYLRGTPSVKEYDRVLFRLGVVYSIPESSVRNIPQAVTLLRQLVSLHPQSPYTPRI